MSVEKDTHNAYRWGRGCRCDVCHTAVIEKSRRQRERDTLRQAGSGTPKRTYVTKEWTAEHMQMLGSDTLSCREIAVLTGHTLTAVESMRSKRGLGRKQRGIIKPRERVEREHVARQRRERVPLPPVLNRGVKVRHIKSRKLYRVVTPPTDGAIQITAALSFGPILRVAVAKFNERYEGEGESE